MEPIRIGTRGSALALWQAGFVQEELDRNYPGIKLEQVIIKTEGDQDQKSSLSLIGGQGVFTRAIEDALLENRVDIAVHSLKDLPSAMTAGLILAAVPERGPVEDVLVTKKGITMEELPEGSTVATGSIRRRSQLLALRPDLHIVDLRGNIDTRLRKLREQGLDGILMARAALIRLKLTDIKYYVFPPDQMIPGVSQGAIGIQIREDDTRIYELLQAVNHPTSFTATAAERSFLHTLDSGCQFPVGACAVQKGDTLNLSGFVGSLDGKTVIRDRIQGPLKEAEAVGEQLALAFLEKGAGQLLRNVSL